MKGSAVRIRSAACGCAVDFPAYVSLPHLADSERWTSRRRRSTPTTRRQLARCRRSTRRSAIPNGPPGRVGRASPAASRSALSCCSTGAGSTALRTPPWARVELGLVPGHLGAEPEPSRRIERVPHPVSPRCQLVRSRALNHISHNHPCGDRRKIRMFRNVPSMSAFFAVLRPPASTSNVTTANPSELNTTARSLIVRWPLRSRDLARHRALSPD
jgi:hypothetical protein